MDAARAAEMADPDRNPNFRRRWDVPPLKREAPPVGGTTQRGNFENATISTNNLDKRGTKFKELVRREVEVRP